MVNIDDIKIFFQGRIALHEPLSKYTSFRIGGPADYFLEPTDKEDVVNIITYLQRQNFPFLMMGKGSNVLVSDDGVRGAVINLEHGLGSMRVEGDIVSVDAGVTMARFVDFCIQHGFKGVEMLSGIPGTIGGAVIMNAGAYGGEISDFLVDVEVLRNGKIACLKKEDAGFAYRRSNFKDAIVLGARFRLTVGDKAEVMRARRELLLKRNRAQPVNMPNSGSMFKNPHGTYAAKLIEDAGLKGVRRGNAQISERHANFIVNLGGAVARDVVDLIELARKTVLEKFGITLELEVKLIGFTQAKEAA
ncbi:MAG: UDP-N-acetylmuramate dehydrogenase [Ignavibacteriae bacterium]|nr:UDP-N-acetylmuramate dehydrogenase [Ignavibacteria bacterium]MBI3364093.1 UDP-N-acetylmuramate dehydrogenase [Ignavibacteriota bacterium]